MNLAWSPAGTEGDSPEVTALSPHRDRLHRERATKPRWWPQTPSGGTGSSVTAPTGVPPSPRGAHRRLGSGRRWRAPTGWQSRCQRSPGNSGEGSRCRSPRSRRSVNKSVGGFLFLPGFLKEVSEPQTAARGPGGHQSTERDNDLPRTRSRNGGCALEPSALLFRRRDFPVPTPVDASCPPSTTQPSGPAETPKKPLPEALNWGVGRS